MNAHLSIGKESVIVVYPFEPLRRMARDGWLKSYYRTLARYRRYCLDDLKIQEQRLMQCCQEHYKIYELISDLDSDLNIRNGN